MFIITDAVDVNWSLRRQALVTSNRLSKVKWWHLLLNKFKRFIKNDNLSKVEGSSKHPRIWIVMIVTLTPKRMHMIRLARGWPSEIAGVWRMLWCTDPLSLRADAAASKYSHVVQQRSKSSRVACATALWTLVCNGCMYSEELRLGRGHNQPLTLINKTDWQIHLMPQSSDRFILNYTSQKFSFKSCFIWCPLSSFTPFLLSFTVDSSSTICSTIKHHQVCPKTM